MHETEESGAFRPVILACRTLELELLEAMRQTQCDYPIVWIPSGLHNTPEKLHETLAQALGQCTGFTHVLAAMGFCGGVFARIETRDASLVLPRADDCITLLLGSFERRKALNAEGVYYFTEGWIKGERTIMAEYRHAQEKYGEARAKRVFGVMLRNYCKAAFLNTGCGNAAWAAEMTGLAASALGLDYCELPGSLCFLERLLSGNWSEKDFVVIPPHTMISSAQLALYPATQPLEMPSGQGCRFSI